MKRNRLNKTKRMDIWCLKIKNLSNTKAYDRNIKLGIKKAMKEFNKKLGILV